MSTKLIIQIPCFNEESSLPATLAELPRRVDGFDTVEWLVVDDGSSDGTVAVARQWGVDHVVRHGNNRGLARAFMTGLETSLMLGATVVVNTDADNQYDASCIPELVAPILEGRAKIVIGTRPIASIHHFSQAKKLLQRLGSTVVRWVSGTHVEDAPSGFRAIHRDAAVLMKVFDPYTYTLETVIQAGLNNVPLASVPIRVNGDLRPSRLVRSIPHYVARSIYTILRIFVIYEPLRFFLLCSTALGVPALLLGLRFLYFYAVGDGDGHVQSLILAALLATGSLLMGVAGILADLSAANRKLLEDLRARSLRHEILEAERYRSEDGNPRITSLSGLDFETLPRDDRPTPDPLPGDRSP